MLANPHRSLAIGLQALPRFSAAGDDEGWCNRPGRRHCVGECVETRLGWWIHERANIAPRYRVDVVLDDSPAPQRFNVTLVECEKTRLVERTWRAQFARAKRMDWPAQSGEISLDSAETFDNRHEP